MVVVSFSTSACSGVLDGCHLVRHSVYSVAGQFAVNETGSLSVA